MLEEITEDAELKLVPVVVMTTFEAGRCLIRSYCLHANPCVVKLIDLRRFIEVVQIIEDFWFAIVKLSPKAEED